MVVTPTTKHNYRLKGNSNIGLLFSMAYYRVMRPCGAQCNHNIGVPGRLRLDRNSDSALSRVGKMQVQVDL